MEKFGLAILASIFSALALTLLIFASIVQRDYSKDKTDDKQRKRSIAMWSLFAVALVVALVFWGAWATRRSIDSPLTFIQSSESSMMNPELVTVNN